MPNFSKSEKILKRSDFTETYKKGSKVHSRSFFLSVKASGARRLGLTVSSKVGNAVTRNRIKRVLREFFRLNKELFPLGDIVVTLKTGAGEKTGAEIREEMERLLKRKKDV